MLKFFLSLIFLFLVSGCGTIEGTPVAGVQAPGPPTDIMVAKTTSTTVVLTWSAAPGEVYAYKIYRDGAEIGVTMKSGPAGAAPTVFTDSNLNPATTYVYSVAASSSFGEEAASPVSVLATTQPAGPLDPPTQVTVTQTTVDSVTLTWQASTYTVPDTTLTYSIYRNGTLIGTTSATAGEGGTYTDTRLAPSTTYYYSISVSTASALSPPVSATTASTGISLSSTVATVAGTAGMPGGADGVAGATFSQPYGVTRLGGYLYLVDTGNHTIRRLEFASNRVTTLAGASGANGSADGIGGAARFNNPRGIATDGTWLYVTDSGNNTVRRVDPSTGEVTTLAGSHLSRGLVDGVGEAARFYAPRGIASDGSYLYVADTYNNAIRKVHIVDAQVTTLAGAKTRGATDGMGGAARFYYPYGITCDGDNLYVTDTCNHTLRKIAIATAQVTTLAGASGSAGSRDGAGSVAGFFYPDGIVSDGENLYVSDTSNFTIRKVKIATGLVATLAGQAGSSGTADGTGGAARFRAPRGMTLFGSQLYLTDFLSHTLRRISLQAGQ